MSIKFSSIYTISSWKASGAIAIPRRLSSFLLACALLTSGSVAAANVSEIDQRQPKINNAVRGKSEINKSAFSRSLSKPKTDTTKKLSAAVKAKRLAQEILAAYGGEPKFKQIYENGCHGFGKYTQISFLSGAANTFDVEIFNKGDKIREEINVLGEQLIGGFDGKHSWLKQYGEVIEDNPAGSNLTREETEHGLQLLLKLSAKNTRLEYIGSSINKSDSNKLESNKLESDKNIYDILKVTTADGASTLVYVDKKSHLITKTEFAGTDEEQGVSVVKSFQFEDYRPFAGTMVPFKVTVYSSDKKVSETILTSIKEEPLSDALFQVPKAKQSLLGKNESITLPFQYAGGEIVINVSINDKPGFAFVVDTGATQNLIDSAIAPQLGQIKQSDLSITTGTGSVPMNYTKLKSLSIGTLVFKDMPVVVADLAALKRIASDKKLVGMLGANIMRQFLTTFDFPNKTITFAHPDSHIDSHNIVSIIPAKPTLGGSAMMIEGELDGKKLDCLIDTGAVYNLIPYELAKQIGDKPLPAENIVHGLDGKPVRVAAGEFKALKLGNETIAHPAFLVAFEKTKPMGMIANGSVAILGNPTWKNYCLTLDYKREKIILSRPAQATKR